MQNTANNGGVRSTWHYTYMQHACRMNTRVYACNFGNDDCRIVNAQEYGDTSSSQVIRLASRATNCLQPNIQATTYMRKRRVCIGHPTVAPVMWWSSQLRMGVHYTNTNMIKCKASPVCIDNDTIQHVHMHVSLEWDMYAKHMHTGYACRALGTHAPRPRSCI